MSEGKRLQYLKVQPGDVVECVITASEFFTVGSKYTVETRKDGKNCIADVDGDLIASTSSLFRLVSRAEWKPLTELNVKPGDVVEYKTPLAKGEAIVSADWQKWPGRNEPWWRLVSRAARDKNLKIWRDMTPEEKGALLLAHHEGKVIECYFDGAGWKEKKPHWFDSFAYRVRPEPVRETVILTGADFGKGQSIAWSFRQNGHIGAETHRITLEIINGVVQPIAKVETLK